MPQAGDTFTVEIKEAHINWGTHRHNYSRNMIFGEGYIQIPARYARRFQIYNSNHPSASPYYICSSIDGLLGVVPTKRTFYTVRLKPLICIGLSN